MNSVLIFGEAGLSEVTEEADRVISLALEAGVDHFDTAADYGVGASEKHYGRWMGDAGPRLPLHQDQRTRQGPGPAPDRVVSGETAGR